MSWLIIPAALLFAASLTQPTLLCADAGLAQAPSGLQLLLTGWMGIANLEFRWFGNLAFVAALWLQLRSTETPRPRRQLLGLVLFAFAAWIYIFPVYACGSVHLHAVSGLGLGVHLWTAALSLAGLGCLGTHPLGARLRR